MVPYCSVLCNSYLQFPKNNLQPTVHYAQLQMRFNRLGVFIFFAQLPKRFFQLNSSITFQSHLFEQASQIHTRKTKKKTIFKTIPPRQSPPVYFFKRSEELAYRSFVRAAVATLRCSALFFFFFFSWLQLVYTGTFRARQQLLLLTVSFIPQTLLQVFTFWPISHTASQVRTRVCCEPPEIESSWRGGPFSPAGLTHGLID